MKHSNQMLDLLISAQTLPFGDKQSAYRLPHPIRPVSEIAGAQMLVSHERLTLVSAKARPPTNRRIKPARRVGNVDLSNGQPD
ncbi:hypothetical protein SAMN05216570_3710 [Dyella sp. OK004]|uniref:hypothetical protein n=1 Tax=Dyella sp. OK004 TaxID=1855292 RepID=UPI0008F11CD9|nr:hypothetical protein [Dyella sp. OK004]SFS18387.1 hypothetical protein SAMN05216570_3710 [Dyella sp. OK004]